MALQRLVGNAAVSEILGEQGAGAAGGIIPGFVPSAMTGWDAARGAAGGRRRRGCGAGGRRGRRPVVSPRVRREGAAAGAAGGVAEAGRRRVPRRARRRWCRRGGAARRGSIFDLIGARGEEAVGAAAGSVWDLP